MNIEIEKLRVTKLREYLINVLNEILTDKNYQINVDMLSNDVNNYSLDKIPTASVVEKWVIGPEKHRDTFNLRAKLPYSQDTINNLENIGFGEIFERKINDNNRKGILPIIDNIEEIKCLSPLTLNYADTNTATFDTQVEITYIVL